jgi:hypothetical protein
MSQNITGNRHGDPELFEPSHSLSPHNPAMSTRPPFATIVHYRHDVIALVQTFCVIQPGRSKLLDRPNHCPRSFTYGGRQNLFSGGEGEAFKNGREQKICLQVSLSFQSCISPRTLEWAHLVPQPLQTLNHTS